jgi:hypothetical protein
MSIRAITALLASADKSDRSSAVQQLAALVDAGGAAEAAHLAPTTVRIDGLGAEQLRDIQKLKETCGRFGTVVEATACVAEAWVLVTFSAEDEAQKALQLPTLDGAAASELKGVVAQRMQLEHGQTGAHALGGGVGEETRVLKEHRRRAGIALAAGAVAPLMQSVLCADASRVDAAEARQASLVLGGLMLLDPVRVGGEWMRDVRFVALWTTPGSALGAVLAKDAKDLTAEDALLSACALTWFASIWCKGADRLCWPLRCLIAAWICNTAASLYLTTSPLATPSSLLLQDGRRSTTILEWMSPTP